MDQSQVPNPPGTPVAPQQAPQAVPEPSQPHSIPTWTPEQAKARLAELQSNAEWLDRWSKGGTSSREAHEFDELTRNAMGQQKPAPKPEPTEEERARAGLGAPASPTDYTVETISGHPIRLDEANRTLIHGTLLPAAHALDLAQSDVTMIAANVMKPTSFEDCDAALHNLWGSDFDKGLDDFRAAVTDSQLRALLEEYPETLGNNPMLIASVVAAYRRRQGRR